MATGGARDVQIPQGATPQDQLSHKGKAEQSFKVVWDNPEDAADEIHQHYRTISA